MGGCILSERVEPHSSSADEWGGGSSMCIESGVRCFLGIYFVAGEGKGSMHRVGFGRVIRLAAQKKL